ncbi:flavodoxin family protein [Amycolatopsis sp. K13G38]|uniref:Flavodoxin family protein n=1 Tax=Amycolatopsis acididurans TaxID=2724524 RepID=A0ABX1IWF4_9PSEU|nr:flavodoxin domain-containing protein [Amycolatopsis acididurans]NKQ51807.1 flavodoxin family protein [Amycolatopsis acididurans]
MRALIVYESMFGNTEVIARAIADGLAAETEVVNVDDAPDALAGFDLLVVGGPTHVHGMSRASTRKSAQDQASDGVRSRKGIRDWLDSLKPAPAGLAAATFDTRIGKPRWLTGSAAVGAAKALKRRHIRVIAKPESFYVNTATPPELGGDERARAQEWGRSIATETAEKS